ncbi:membrane dipeptidase [Caulobacter sp. 17J65-9]|uniref:dipeptidase n=1 Tax=Caulobacter sp. 17J65-9 TaxID=2709382 RepID=UPI0013CCD22C|nr:membrane dipeptidase [Caulobacter sp. 17J65-9]NEX95116.1 Zn-dependent dipeptidase [Caulobacter sp. 17J65-9]
MIEAMNRRGLLGAALGLGAATALGGRALAGEDTAAVVERLFRTGLIIDGNLAPPIDDSAPLPKEWADKVLSSALTAAKVTVVGPGTGYDDTKTILAAYQTCTEMNPTVYRNVRTMAEIEALRGKGPVGLIWSFETTEMLDGKPERIAEFAALGVKVMQLSYNTASPFGGGVMTPAAEATGLTELGRQAIASMEANRVALDLSHADERTTLDAVRVYKRPPLLTHTGAAAVHPHPRNKSDRAIRAVADKGGVVGIYDLSFITPLRPSQPTVDDYMAHLMHVLKVAGEDHVGVGSDAVLTGWDTSPESMKRWDEQNADRKKRGVAAPEEGRPPYVEGMNSPDRMKVVAAELLKRGVRERAVAKIMGGNFARVFRDCWGG